MIELKYDLLVKWGPRSTDFKTMSLGDIADEKSHEG